MYTEQAFEDMNLPFSLAELAIWLGADDLFSQSIAEEGCSLVALSPDGNRRLFLTIDPSGGNYVIGQFEGSECITAQALVAGERVIFERGEDTVQELRFFQNLVRAGMDGSPVVVCLDARDYYRFHEMTGLGGMRDAGSHYALISVDENPGLVSRNAYGTLPLPVLCRLLDHGRVRESGESEEIIDLEPWGIVEVVDFLNIVCAGRVLIGDATFHRLDTNQGNTAMEVGAKWNDPLCHAGIDAKGMREFVNAWKSERVLLVVDSDRIVVIGEDEEPIVITGKLAVDLENGGRSQWGAAISHPSNPASVAGLKSTYGLAIDLNF